MGKVKEIISSMERNKGKIMRIFIFFSIIKFFITAIYRIYDDRTVGKYLEITMNIYSILILGIIFLYEFCNCLLPNFIVENFKIITNFTGKGIIFILISIILINPTLGNQQNYSGYILLCVGILSIIADFKLDINKNEIKNLLKQEKQTPNMIQIDIENDKNHSNSDNLTREVKIETSESEKPKIDNPYDIPEDF